MAMTSKKMATLMAMEKNEPEDFMEWAEDLYNDDPNNLQALLSNKGDRAELIEQWVDEKCHLSVRDDGLIEFWTDFYDEDCDVSGVIGNLPVVVYHHTATGAIPGIIERGGLVPATSLGFEPTEHDSRAYVFVTTNISGPEINGYTWRAVQTFGGNPVMLTIKTTMYKLSPDPDDADLSVGKTQFILPFVSTADIVEGLDAVKSNPVRRLPIKGNPVVKKTSKPKRTGAPKALLKAHELYIQSYNATTVGEENELSGCAYVAVCDYVRDAPDCPYNGGDIVARWESKTQAALEFDADEWAAKAIEVMTNVKGNPVVKKTSKTVPEAIKRAADGLLKWRGTEAMGGKDVLAWVKKNGEPAFAVQGPDVRLQNRSLNGNKSMFNNHNMMLDASLQKAVGLDVQVARDKYGSRISGGAGQTMGTGMVSADELDQGITSVLAEALEVDTVHFTLMPMAGKPWISDQKCTPYYSAKKQKVLCGTKPDGLINVEKYDNRTDRYIKVKGVDFCTVAPMIKETEGGIVGRISGDSDEHKFMLMHSFNLDPVANAGSPVKIAKAISDCGGMLYPSLAIAEVPSINFGTCCLFARLPLALRVLKPYKVRTSGVLPVTVYNTDAWTDVTRDFMGSSSSELFDQLTGAWDIQYGSHIMTLGPRMMEDARSMGPEVRVLKSVSNLRSALKRKRSRWVRGMTQSDIEDATDATDLRYPYLEVKVNGILQVPDTFPLAVCPGYLKSRTQKFLHAIGFNGHLISIPVSGSSKDWLQQENPKAQWDYAWLVRDAVIAWQEQQDAGHKTTEQDWLEGSVGYVSTYGSIFNTPTLAKSNPTKRQVRSNPVRYAYHVTHANRLESIEEKGLSPKASGAVGRGGYAGHSDGRLFLTDADGVDFWYGKAEEVANDLSDNPFEDGFTPVVLRMPMPKTKSVDEPGSSDSGHDAWYVTKRIPVGWKSRKSGHIEIWNGSTWIKIWDRDNVDLLLAYDAEQNEAEDSEELYFRYQNNNPLAQIGRNGK